MRFAKYFAPILDTADEKHLNMLSLSRKKVVLVEKI